MNIEVTLNMKQILVLIYWSIISLVLIAGIVQDLQTVILIGSLLGFFPYWVLIWLLLASVPVIPIFIWELCAYRKKGES